MNTLKRINIDCNECNNSKCLVKKCSTEYVSILSNKKSQIVLSRGQYIFQENSPVFGMYFIQEGKVKIVSSNLLGKEQIVRLANKEHVLGHRGEENEFYNIGAIAIEDTRVCLLNNVTLLDAFKKNHKFTFEVMMFYSRELRKSEIRTKYFAQMTVDEKVMYALVYIIETFGLHEDEKYINAIFSRNEIANIAGTNSDQVSRTFSSLKKQELIYTEGNKIIIQNYEQFKKLISTDIHDII